MVTAPRVSYTLTRSQPPGWIGYSGRVDAAMLAEIAWPASQHPLACFCGPTRFVETVAGKLVALGYPAGPGQDRAVRRDLMVLDGNAIGGRPCR